MEGGIGGCLSIPARLVEGELILDGALGSVEKEREQTLTFDL
jgi:hypothetical protein